jgi:hypothetical protein
MKEDYLHSIWRLKRFPMHQLKLVDGKPIQILKTGWHNHDAGPDFFNGSIKIDDIVINGNIEIHINASDWYAHKHHLDQAYDNVILHVVLNNDKDVYIKDYKIPCLEIKNYIDKNHQKMYSKLIQSENWIPCQNQIKLVQEQVIVNQIENAVIDRLIRKNKLINKRYIELQQDSLQLYFEIYAQAFGLKVNSLPMTELTTKIKITNLWRNSVSDAEIILFGLAGFFQNSEKFGLLEKELGWKFQKIKHNYSEMELHTWKFKGLRPPSFPPIKLKQFTTFCFEKDFFRIHDLSMADLFSLCDKMSFSKDFRNNILINAIIPILWWRFEHENKIELKGYCLSILQKIKAEKNHIISKWQKLNISCKSSFESQGLLEIKNELCSNKKCLTCKIGYSILNQ